MNFNAQFTLEVTHQSTQIVPYGIELIFKAKFKLDYKETKRVLGHSQKVKF